MSISNPDFSLFSRDTNGLLKTVQYVYKQDGYIDWRAMVKPEHLAINRQKEKTLLKMYGKPLDQLSVSEVDDKYLLILLGGIKELARLRGVRSVKQHVDVSTPQIATVTCTIEFDGNYETNGAPVIWSDTASATPENTEDFSRMYLSSIAANRAFVRAVRGFLNIHIVGKDEIKEGTQEADEPPPSKGNEPTDVLERKASEKGISFEQVKKAAQTKYRAEISGDPSLWTGYDSIQPPDAWVILGKLDKV